MFKIEKGIPIPHKTAGKGKLYPFDKMEVGDSFFVEMNSSAEKIFNKQRSILSAAHSRYRSAKKFTTRMYNDGVRVWRVR